MATSDLTHARQTTNPATQGPNTRDINLAADALREITDKARAISVGTESIDDNTLELFTIPAMRALAQQIGWLADAALQRLHQEPALGGASAWMFPDLERSKSC
ncbi:hypothetical protein [uncultured Aquabacterium sp.]|uniref:hypothetical protein n=1 Tax=uncultured Aquabacterium sp. TaxID=158753 RepID=UPI00261E9107|nr:hypothetical protein [uncultured Aquabacterium sp.]